MRTCIAAPFQAFSNNRKSESWSYFLHRCNTDWFGISLHYRLDQLEENFRKSSRKERLIFWSALVTEINQLITSAKDVELDLLVRAFSLDAEWFTQKIAQSTSNRAERMHRERESGERTNIPVEVYIDMDHVQTCQQLILQMLASLHRHCRSRLPIILTRIAAHRECSHIPDLEQAKDLCLAYVSRPPIFLSPGLPTTVIWFSVSKS